MTNQAQRWLRIVAEFELLAAVMGLLSLIFYLRALVSGFVPLLFVYAVLTIANLVAGILLWRLQYWGIITSLLLQLIQIPYYASASFPYTALGLNFTLKQGWFAHDGVEAHEIGFNVFALALLLVLLRCERLWQPATTYAQMAQDEKREAEALACAEATVADVADERR